ncbi:MULTISPECIES: LCP family protein [unclassified Micromonospora]|uniref:LCP family protein n=1 Tax=unclassified Micromonospora TaxID=2617518 RepID=UPI002FEF8FFC
MTEDELRAAFARHESLTPPVGPLRAAVDRIVVRRRRRRRRLRVGAAALAVLGLLGIAVPRVVPSLGGHTAAAEFPADRVAPRGVLNVLLVGVDGAPDSRVRGADFVPRADSVLLVHVPADRSRLYLVSLPRDLMVAIPGHGTQKLNSSFQLGATASRPDLRRGYDLTRRVVADTTGVRIDAGAVLTYPVLRRLTDGVGGVEVCLPEQVRSVHTRRVFPAGCQRLDGTGSVDLLRQRYGMTWGAQDRDRNAQRYAAGLVRQLGSGDTLRNPVALSRLLVALGPDLVADTGEASLPELLTRTVQASRAAPVGLVLPTVEAPERPGSTVLDERAAPAFLSALRQDRLAGWVAANPDRVTALGAQR